MSDVMTWWLYMAAQWNFNRYACGLGTIQSDMPPGPLKIKEKSNLTNAPPSGMPTNIVKLYQAYCYIVNTAADQTWILGECCYKMDGCWTVATQLAYLLIFCHSTLHVYRRCASLSAIPASMMSRYQPCLLVWFLTIGHVFWCGASLSAVSAGVVPHYKSCLPSSGVVPHYQPCLLVWCLTIGNAFWCGASLKAIWCGASL